MAYHIPVLLKEVTDELDINSGNYIDCTLGGGGHFSNILSNLKSGIVVGVDMDINSIQRNKVKLLENGYLLVSEKDSVLEFNLDEKKVFLIKDNFKHILKIKKEIIGNNDCFKGILFDLGVSSKQLDDVSRGFSYMRNTSLDMRMDQNLPIKAEDLINGLFASELEKIISSYGEERYAKDIAKGIVRERNKKRILTSEELCEVIRKSVPESYENPYRRTFQALRIAVNDELGSLKTAIKDLDEIVCMNGKVNFITFHSLERKIIELNLNKNIFKKIKEIDPTDIEIKSNKRSKSAKLLIYEKIR